MKFPSYVHSGDAKQRQVNRQQATDLIRSRGTEKRPQPPRDIVCQSGSRGFVVSWKLPQISSEIDSWRVYKDDENSLYISLKDRGTRQVFVQSTAGATPPIVNVFVSSVNALGRESLKVQSQGSASIEAAGATPPAVPSLPPAYTQEAAGGGNLTLVGDKSNTTDRQVGQSWKFGTQ